MLVANSQTVYLTCSGTSKGIEEPTLDQKLKTNILFIQTMIIPLIVIITAIVLWDKRK
ncbi:hypothetical protein [Nitrosopumilus sp. b3]|uniref:hypothetical protein n=1 Tax=Nitrosopumilus sp. b3 TaxID=2109909 RepID=UPI0015F63C58|nr:hypothetical protein [Nitrosopumilus sp. b3]